MATKSCDINLSPGALIWLSVMPGDSTTFILTGERGTGTINTPIIPTPIFPPINYSLNVLTPNAWCIFEKSIILSRLFSISNTPVSTDTFFVCIFFHFCYVKKILSTKIQANCWNEHSISFFFCHSSLFDPAFCAT